MLHRTELAQAVVEQAEARGRRQALEAMLEQLTPRQLEVAVLIANGYSNQQIAERLVLTSGTVANHVAQLLERLGMDSRAQVAALIGELGLHHNGHPSSSSGVESPSGRRRLSHEPLLMPHHVARLAAAFETSEAEVKSDAAAIVDWQGRRFRVVRVADRPPRLVVGRGRRISLAGCGAGRQAPKSLALAAANSSSVSAPDSLSWASCCSWGHYVRQEYRAKQADEAPPDRRDAPDPYRRARPSAAT